MLKLRMKIEKSRQNSEDQYEQKQYFSITLKTRKIMLKGTPCGGHFSTFFQKLLAESHTHTYCSQIGDTECISDAVCGRSHLHCMRLSWKLIEQFSPWQGHRWYISLISTVKENKTRQTVHWWKMEKKLKDNKLAIRAKEWTKADWNEKIIGW